MSRSLDFNKFWDNVSLDDIRNNSPTSEYTFDMVRHVTMLMEETKAFFAHNPNISQSKVDTMIKRLNILEKERLCQINILAGSQG